MLIRVLIVIEYCPVGFRGAEVLTSFIAMLVSNVSVDLVPMTEAFRLDITSSMNSQISSESSSAGRPCNN